MADSAAHILGYAMSAYIDSLCLSTALFAFLLLVAAYYALKILYHIYVFFTTVYKYKPNNQHLQPKSTNKLRGKVRRKNGEAIEEEMLPMVPNGWYYVMTSAELGKEQVKHVVMCGLDLAVFRDVNGDVHALDAFCPHLGANMGVGGKVKGTCLECPFHGWKFKGEDGKCVDIPGAKRVPNFAKTKTWSVLEWNLVIILWFDAEDRDPLYVPTECEDLDKNWVIHAIGEHTVHCHISEIPENGADIAHFNPIHQGFTMLGSDLEGINKSNSQTLKHVYTGITWEVSPINPYQANGTLDVDISIYECKLPFSWLTMKSSFEQIGPSMVLILPDLGGKILLMQLVVPLEMFKQRLIHVAIGPNTVFGKLQSIFALRAENAMIERDIMVWNNKLFTKRSVFSGSRSDEMLVKFRRWYSQFYSENSKTKPAQNINADLSW